MDERTFYIGRLIARALRQELSAEERAELDAWRMSIPENQVLLEELSDPGKLSAALDQFYRYDLDANRAKIGQLFPGLAKPRRVLSFPRWMLAACVILLAGIGIFHAVRYGGIGSDQPAHANDVAAPVANRARITLGNGNTVYLDSAGNGLVATQGNIRLVKESDGQIAYRPVAATGPAALDTATVYNTITNPRGSRVIHVKLSDGSQVWLNAESSLRYPTVFKGPDRTVSITGEAYLEVARNATQPFMLVKGALRVQVLGTRFNVNAYDEERTFRVTLLEGSVKVTKGLSAALLKPGEQAQVRESVQVAGGVDVEEVMAWKNGQFRFNQTDIQTVMRQISRWYDVDITYPKGIPKDTYWGVLQRDLQLSTVCKVLQESGAHFTIEGNKVTVYP